MNNWQEWAVLLILILCFVYVANKIYRFILRTKKNENPCDSCATGCSLKDMVHDKMEGNKCCSPPQSKIKLKKVDKKK